MAMSGGKMCSVNLSTPLSCTTQSVSKQDKSSVTICPICEDVIKDPSPKSSGQDAVFCEGICNTWIHRRCAGLSKTLFTAISKSDDAFCCPHCRLDSQSSELISLRKDFVALSAQLSDLRSLLSSQAVSPPVPSTTTESVFKQAPTSGSNVISKPKQPIHSPHSSPPSLVARQYNVVVHGLVESSSSVRSNRKFHDFD